MTETTKTTEPSNASKKKSSKKRRRSRWDKWLMSSGITLVWLNFLLAVLALVVFGDEWIDWSYQTTIAVSLAIVYLIILGGLQRFTKYINPWRTIPILLFSLYPWWVMIRELVML